MKNKITTLLLILVSTFSASAQTESNDTINSTNKFKKYKPEISGVLQIHYFNEFNTNGDSLRDPDGFRILRARLTAKGKINDFVSYVMMIDPRAPEQGGILRDAYIDFKISKNQTFRFGQQKTHFGYENNESITELYVVNRADMSDNLSRGYNLRDAGIGLLGNIKINGNVRIDNAFTYTNGARLNVRGPYDFSNTKNGWGRLGIQYKKEEFMTRYGVSAGMGGIRDLGTDLVDPVDDIFIKFKRIGSDIEVENKYFIAVAEYAMGTNLVADTLTNTFGYYVTVIGKSKWDIGPLLRFDATDDEFKRTTIGAYYGKPKDRFRVLINYEFRGGITDVPGGHDDRLYIQCQVRF